MQRRYYAGNISTNVKVAGTMRYCAAEGAWVFRHSPAVEFADGLAADFLEPPGAQLNDLYLIVHSVQTLKAGSYFFHRERNTLELLKEGDFRAEAYHLGLEQELPAYACVDIFFWPT